jgi:hypothetical protein
LTYGLPVLANDPARQAAVARVQEAAWQVALLLLVPMPFAAITAWQRRRRRREQRILEARRRPAPSNISAPPLAEPDDGLTGGLIRLCPRCGSKMVIRTMTSGPLAGQKVWRCVAFPRCRAAEPHEE